MTRYAQRTLIQQGTVANWGKAAPAGIGVKDGYGVATGGTPTSITDTVAYTLLTFTSSGTLTVSTAGLFDVMVIGGGGGGGGATGTGGTAATGGVAGKTSGTGNNATNYGSGGGGTNGNASGGSGANGVVYVRFKV